MINKQVYCSWRFTHPERPRDFCGLPAGSDGLCIFHSDLLTPNFAEALEEEVSKPQHWLEGAIIKQGLTKVRLTGAHLPNASFEGQRLVNVLLDNALLERANFRSSCLEGTIFCESNLQFAAFDQAILQLAGDFPVDLRGVELGGASFTGATFKSVKLLGVKFSKPTPMAQLVKMPCFEMESGDWDNAATIYGILAKRAAEDWDFASSDLCSYRAATCRHRRVIKAGSMQGKNVWRNWVIPTIRAGFTGLGWAAHQLVWGYGLRPLRALGTVFFVILFFGLLVFPFTGSGKFDQGIADGLIRSLANFVTLDYQAGLVARRVDALAGGVEALLGAVLLSLFLVALAGKYLRKV